MVILDVEASGTEPAVHSVLSVGAFDFSQPDNRFYEECRLFEGAHVMDGALAVNGFTEEEIHSEEKQSEAALVEKFLQWTESCSDRTLCGQNVSFDRDFLRAAAGRAHLSWPLAYRTVDTHTLCYMHMIKRGYEVPIDKGHKRTMLNLNTILNYCGIDREPDPHNALTGALCHGEVASRLLYDKHLLPEFADIPIPWL